MRNASSGVATPEEAPSVGSLAPEPLGLLLSKIAFGSSTDPDGCLNTLVRIHKEGSQKMAKHSIKSAGVDTGKFKLDVAVHGTPDKLEVANAAAGYESLIDWLRAREIERIGIEASGGYEKPVTAALRLAGFRSRRRRQRQVVRVGPGGRRAVAVMDLAVRIQPLVNLARGDGTGRGQGQNHGQKRGQHG